MQSIHGQALARGNQMAPVCTDCHGIHSIKAHYGSEFAGGGQESFRAICARAATRACGCRRSLAYRAIAFRATLTAITAWLRRAVRWWWLTAQVATACTTFCHRAIRIRPSITPTWERPVASATKGVTQKFTQTKVHQGDGVHPQRHRLDCGAVGADDLHHAYPAGDRSHVRAQRDHLAQQSC